MRHPAPVLVTLLVVAALATAALPRAQAGPPCICWDLDIGDAESLPWGGSGFSTADDYDPRRLVDDTLRILGPETRVIVRMETLRRAALYMERTSASRDALLRALMERVLDAASDGREDALALFDAGYARACFEQLGDLDEGRAYAWVDRASVLRKRDPAMELALALVAAMPRRGGVGTGRAADHFARAVEGGAADPLLLANTRLVGKRLPALLRHWEQRAER